jgi:hypothetical protein
LLKYRIERAWESFEEVRCWYDEVKKFVEIIEGIVKKEMGND